ncbi:probable inactive ATP-dependent zinc metalloprotease FTSHI 2, chloroplastic [Vigna radiata var. radiata]|uniref:Probable inactive ATP-dependent zinc metalloprotease FTSHI 2, chloroplastic n=1 Tax=Vigna radiata var. radiata TaxID=3916 RepID=A0A1S3U6L6_VIGRR|nr:probable inactive ATP-dependent zinc metalloprotease FTSHI 2, chloroplastic [Vigna radiata var. radiata]
MASNCFLRYSSSSFLLNPKFRSPPKSPYYPSVFSRIPTPKSDNDDNKDDNHKTPNHNRFDFLKLSVTLTVISASLPQPAAAAAAVTKGKKRSSKKQSAKKSEALSPEELKTWSRGLPVVSDRLPYSEIVELKKDGKLKHIIKPISAKLRQRSEAVLVVLDDSRVLRTVLPSVESHSEFWDSWDALKIDSVCVNAYTPPIKRPEWPSPLLSNIYLPPFLQKFLFDSPEDIETKPRKESKKAAEYRKMRMELKREKEEELRRLRQERETTERNIKAQKKEEERRRRREMKKRRYRESMRQASDRDERMADFWSDLANNSNVSNALGVLFFYIFYRTVVLSYRKHKKDYEDRLKIEQAEAEERKKMRELEREMEGIEGDDEEIEQGKGEENNYLKVAKQFMRSGARVRRAQNRRLPQYLERGVDVKFSDVAGLGKIRLELEEIVKFFTHGEMYRRRGVKIPGGILLCGPPGVGKTLLAKAVAGEAGVNFFSISASQFVEIYVGVGASRVRALYQEARENAPSVVFIDELDAVGRERGLIKGSGGQERDATLNQLLVCLDGFEGRGEVITIASTNRPDILDPALVRPGRFDRKIYIPKPGLIGRIEILQVHARKKPMAEDVDYMAVASMTDGMVGAELANIIEVAAINMMRDSRTEITTDDLLQAAQMEERGMLDRKERSTETWKQVAINEAAMAIVAVNFPDLKNIEFVTIAPRAGRELGYVRVKMDSVKFNNGMLTRQSLLDHITVQLAPRAADELWFGSGQLSTIWAETADNARSAARTFVLGGLSEKYHGMSNFWVSDRINDIDSEAMRILDSCYERAKEILEKNRRLMDAVVNELVEKKSLTKQEFFRLVDLHGSLEPMPPSILDIRIAKCREFQKLIDSGKEASLSSHA